MAAIPSATRISPDDCTCVVDGCGFLAPPRVLLDHLVAEHSMRAVRITYGEQYQIVVPASERQLLLLAEENEGVFLLTVSEPIRRVYVEVMRQAVQDFKAVAVQCLRARATAGPAYTCMISAEALEPVREGGRVSSRDGPARYAQAYELPVMLHGESKAVHLRISISIAPKPSWRRVLKKCRCF